MSSMVIRNAPEMLKLTGHVLKQPSTCGVWQIAKLLVEITAGGQQCRDTLALRRPLFPEPRFFLDVAPSLIVNLR